VFAEDIHKDEQMILHVLDHFVQLAQLTNPTDTAILFGNDE
jgi:hypothetical protein